MENVSSIRIPRALQDTFGSEYKNLLTSDEFHAFEIHCDWFSGCFPQTWVVKNPECDLGTAIFIYWRAQPIDFYERYLNRDEIISQIPDDVPIEQYYIWTCAYDLVKTIENNVQHDFYKNKQICFDPSEVVSFERYIQQLNSRLIKQKIPEIMFRATPGKEFDSEIYWPSFDEIKRGI